MSLSGILQKSKISVGNGAIVSVGYQKAISKHFVSQKIMSDQLTRQQTSSPPKRCQTKLKWNGLSAFRGSLWEYRLYLFNHHILESSSLFINYGRTTFSRAVSV